MRNGILILILITCFLLPTSANAQSVDILWQGETYTPPFYKGGSLWTKQAMIHFVAIPQGLGNPATLNYRWTQNGTVLGGEGGASGVGRNTISLIDSILSKTQTIEVEIVNGDATLVKQSVTITPSAPILALYENNPLYGFMFHKEVGGSYKLAEREITFSAFPLFFSVANRGDSIIEYVWRTNANEENGGNSVTYRAPDNAAGSSQVSVRASNKDKVTQDTSKNFLIEFGK